MAAWQVQHASPRTDKMVHWSMKYMTEGCGQAMVNVVKEAVN